MRNEFMKKMLLLVLSSVLVLAFASPVFADEAADSVKGRSVVVQDVSGTNGSAEIVRKGTSFAPSKGLRLVEGDTVRTSGDNRVYLVVDDEMILRVDENSEAYVSKSILGQKLCVTLNKGEMFYNVAKNSTGNEALELMANNVTIAVRGTSGIITVGNGKVQHGLFDGTVHVSDSRTTVEQKPGQKLTVNTGYIKMLEEGTQLTEFTLNDLPKSVVEEMKKDRNLMTRVLGSVPVSVNEDGTKQFANEAYFNANITGVEDKETYAASLKPVPSSGGSGSSGGSSPAPAPVPVPVPQECPYAHQGELYYIREVISDGYYKIFSYRYDSSQDKFMFMGAGYFSASGSDHKAGEWVHYHIMDGFLGVCTQNGDGAVIPAEYTVRFDMNGFVTDEVPEDQKVVEGGRASNPGTNFRTRGHVFEGWYKEAECVNKWDFAEDAVTGDITLYANWQKKSLDVYFDNGGGKDGPESFVFTYGDKLPTLEKLPEKDICKFQGYTDVYSSYSVYDDKGSPVEDAEDSIWNNVDIVSNSSVTFYAHWYEPPLTLTRPALGAVNNAAPEAEEEEIAEEAAPAENAVDEEIHGDDDLEITANEAVNDEVNEEAKEDDTEIIENDTDVQEEVKEESEEEPEKEPDTEKPENLNPARIPRGPWKKKETEETAPEKPELPEPPQSVD